MAPCVINLCITWICVVITSLPPLPPWKEPLGSIGEVGTRASLDTGGEKILFPQLGIETQFPSYALYSQFAVLTDITVLRFEVFVAVTMKKALFWDVVPYMYCVN